MMFQNRKLTSRIEVIWAEGGYLWADGWAYWTDPDKDDSGIEAQVQVTEETDEAVNATTTTAPSTFPNAEASVTRDEATDAAAGITTSAVDSTAINAVPRLPEQRILRAVRPDQPEIPGRDGQPIRNGFHLVWKPGTSDRYTIRVLTPDGETADSLQVSKSRLLQEEIERNTGFHAVKTELTQQDYENWFARRKISASEYQTQKKDKAMPGLTVLVYMPLESLKTEKEQDRLRDTIRSLKEQSYPNWHLCIRPRGSAAEDKKQLSFLRKAAFVHRRIHIVRYADQAREKTKADILWRLEAGDQLEPDALYRIVRIYALDDTQAVYTDHDTVGSKFSAPKLKPDFNLDLLRSQNYLARSISVRTTFLDKLRIPAESGSYELALRLAEQTESRQAIRHIPRILCHLISKATDPKASEQIHRQELAALNAHLERCGIEAKTRQMEGAPEGCFWFPYPIRKKTKISIIILNHDQPEILKQCIDSIFRTAGFSVREGAAESIREESGESIREESGEFADQSSTPVDFEIIIVENNSTDPKLFAYYDTIKRNPHIRILTRNKPFNYSAFNNFAAGQAEGDLLLFLNNDVEAIRPGWLEAMAGDCQRWEVGAAGARLLYPDGRIQHSGIIAGIGGVAGNVFSGLDGKEAGYMNRAKVRQDLSAATGACLMMRRDIFQKVGGFDENLEVDFNDVDLCLRIVQLGKLIVLESGVELYHHESLSRGGAPTLEKHARFRRETLLMQKRWAGFLAAGDPAYNPGLTLSRGDFSLRED